MYMKSIKSPAKALKSLLQRSELDTESKEIVCEMMRLQSEYIEESNARSKANKQGGGSRKQEG